MITKTTHKKALLFVAAVALAFIAIIPGCKKSKSDLGKEMAKATGNKAFKDMTNEGFAEAFKKAMADNKSSLTYPDVIASYYSQNEYEPTLVLNNLKEDGLKILTTYLSNASQHGINPQIFRTDTIKALLARMEDKKAIKNVEQAYSTLAKLELLTANSLMRYSNAMQYGLISPRKIYQRYYTATLRPDSASNKKIFAVKELKNYLDSIQPKSPQYKALQKALADKVQAPGLSAEESERYFAVNLERLRWKNKPDAKKYVIVNIPDYRLDVMEDGKSALNMKVCVGEGRNMDKDVTLVEYDESDKVDRPFSRETPQLNSQIYTVQVNPVWNIPTSIASKEIMVEAAQDPYYLDNKGIDVYRNGKKVDDPETIDWGSASKTEYSFKQRPGDGNALGKIKFLFKNGSSVYLHDTPAKNAFNQNMRAVSHGCVRVEQPQKLAEALFGNGDKYKTIVEKMENPSPEPTDIALPNKVPVYLTYVTCWADEGGKIQFRPDVYGLDVVLYGQMKKLLTV
ncbi:L,D-transpeptidase family protein [Mucilaginibacter sp. UR6-1]|uniref:L,D-transpeptidase family protein n=1 Tax=Mucilaginibacter sp. UR6-1 TaxID=1435643 RepID=UPI001E38BE5B|nr:L,D-transpeptidase family protein [Mucilaginibacter sp. UR6-1]MCC8409051.1 L,D-transpeptidase family protein [Mucilaginibacter sp. UR6-1]